MAYYHTVGDGLRAILSGKVDWINGISNLDKPPIIALPNESFFGDEVIDSHKAIQIMNEALRGYPEYESLHVQEMFSEHQKIFPSLGVIDYSISDCVCYNGDIWFDEADCEILLEKGAKKQDVELSNAIMMHEEQEVIRFLHLGATPYFLDAEIVDIKDLYYEEVAPALGHLEEDIYYWWTEVPKLFPNDNMSMTDDELCNTIFALYNIAAHRHILQVVNDNILPDVKQRGEAFMRQMGVIE